jgi:molecular chaperone DnaK
MTKVIGVDFGTTRSYFSICPSDDVKPQGVTFGGVREGVATAILYREGTAMLLIGDEALQEWSEIPQGEKTGYLLRTQFKPDIAVNQAARKCARQFLTAALQEVRKVAPERNARFVFGIPSEADLPYVCALKEIAKEAGYGEVTTME